MAAKSNRRGAVAALGLFLLFAGLVGGGVLYVLGERRPANAVDGFARAPIGCTTTLEFSEVGDFFVYEEVGATEDVDTCEAVATPGVDFAVDFVGDLQPLTVRADDSVSYDVDAYDGRSLQQISIIEPGTYAVSVTGDDLTVLAAIGRDPADGVDELRQTALIVAIAGGLAGVLLLLLSGRRSKQASAAHTPVGPGWGPSTPQTSAWPPAAPDVARPSAQVPVNPHAPPTDGGADGTIVAGSGPVWQPPQDVAEPDSGADGSDGTAVNDALPPPRLPDGQGRPSGT